MKYLYIFDGGEYKVYDNVGKDEIENITNGHLDVVRFKDGNFEELDIDGKWTLVTQDDTKSGENEQDE